MTLASALCLLGLLSLSLGSLSPCSANKSASPQPRLRWLPTRGSRRSGLSNAFQRLGTQPLNITDESRACSGRTWKFRLRGKGGHMTCSNIHEQPDATARALLRRLPIRVYKGLWGGAECSRFNCDVKSAGLRLLSLCFALALLLLESLGDYPVGWQTAAVNHPHASSAGDGQRPPRLTMAAPRPRPRRACSDSRQSELP